MRGSGTTQSQDMQANLEQVPLMLQTEDRFTSLPHAVGALLAMYGVRSEPDVLSAVTGDCFAVQVFPQEGCRGLADCPDLLRTALVELGLSVRWVADEVTVDSRMRVFAIMRAGLVNFRPSLVCGGWEAGTGACGELCWGVISRTHPTEPRFVGSRMQAPFADGGPVRDIAWPLEDSPTAGVILVEGWRDPRVLEAALVRRSLHRGLSLLAGDQGLGGPGEHARLLHRLTGPDRLQDDPAAAGYPYPTLLYARCRFEAMARVLGRALSLVPRRRRAACRQAMELAAASGQMLLHAEPRRAHRRADTIAVEAGTTPWPPEAWQDRARGLDDPDSDTRRREVALIEHLREMHVALIEALDTLLARI